MDDQQARDAILDYEALLAKREELAKIYSERRDLILESVREELDALDAEMKPTLDFANVNLDNLDKAAKQAVLQLGRSARGEQFEFRYFSGSTTWDGKKLDGMAELIPELNTARHVGQPRVAIYKLEKKDG